MFKQTSAECSKTPDCYCVPMGDCFMRKIIFDIDNCQLGVPLDMIDAGILDLDVTSFNKAGLQANANFEVGYI